MAAMAILTSSCASSEQFGHRCLRARRFNFNGDIIALEPEIHFICCRKRSLSASISLFYYSLQMKSNKIKPLSSLTPPSSQFQVDIQPTEMLIPDQYQLTVRVRLQLQKQCQFGEQFLVVGSDQVLGSWNPMQAIPMDWSDGHVWTAELDIPCGEPIKFKFILRLKSGQVLWQPGPDRILPNLETRNTICIFEDWEKAEVQQVTEEEIVKYQPEEPTGSCGSSVVADNLSQLGNDEMAHLSKHLKQTKGVVDVEQKPEVRSTSYPAAAHDATTCTPLQEAEENLKITLTGSCCTKESIAVVSDHSDMLITGNILDSDMLVAGNILDGSDGEPNWSLQSTVSEGYLEKFEEIPILAPGLNPCSALPAEDLLELEISDNPAKASDSMTKLDQAIEDNSLPEREQSISLTLAVENSEVEDSIPFEDRPAAQNSHFHEVKDAGDLSSAGSEILQSDFKWGQTILKMLLNHLSFRRMRF
ncbi:hypothetical protein Dimus_000533 [Dionaea muscipula]